MHACLHRSHISYSTTFFLLGSLTRPLGPCKRVGSACVANRSASFPKCGRCTPCSSVSRRPLSIWATVGRAGLGHLQPHAEARHIGPFVASACGAPKRWNIKIPERRTPFSTDLGSLILKKDRWAEFNSWRLEEVRNLRDPNRVSWVLDRTLEGFTAVKCSSTVIYSCMSCSE